MNYDTLVRLGLPGSLTAALWLTAAAALGTPVPPPQPGELFAGFRATDGQGSSTSYLIKLGQDTTFRNAAPGTSFAVAGLGGVGADLSAAFGTNWSTRPEVQWGIFGVRTSVNSTVYGSRGRVTAGVPAEAWPALTSTGRNAVAGAITSVLEEVGGYKASEATANSAVATLQTNTAEASSYARQVGTAGTTDFSSLSQWTSIEANFGAGPAGAVLDVFRVGSTGSTLLGTFSISAAGQITFAAVTPVSQGDTDGDGFSDEEEAVAGTLPNDGSSFPLAQVTFTSEGPRIESATAPNRTYTIEYSESLASGTWTPIGTHAAGPAANPLAFLDGDPARLAKGRGHYRVRIAL